MAEARIEHVFPCTEDAFWKVFFDPAYNNELFLKVLGFESWNQVSLQETDARIERVVDAVPKLGDLPGPLKKLAEGGVGYREKNSLDRKAKRMIVTIEPTTMRDKLSISGVMHTEAVGDGQCRRIYEQTVTAKVFAVGGLIESRILSDVKASYDKAAEFTKRWLAEKAK
jgi:hypothetical protein